MLPILDFHRDLVLSDVVSSRLISCPHTTSRPLACLPPHCQQESFQERYSHAMSETFNYSRELSMHSVSNHSVSIHSDAETNNQTSDDCDETFHPFPRLPAELRDDIWTKALPGKGYYPGSKEIIMPLQSEIWLLTGSRQVVVFSA